MRPRPWDWIFVILPAAAFILVFLGVAGARLTYPFELEWMEGGSWLQALRLAHDQPLYVQPTLEFTPFIYTPFYFWLSSRLGDFGLLTMPAMRCLSFFSSLALIALLGRWVYRETRHVTAAMLTMGIYAASFAACGFFFDLARADALWLLLLFASAYVLYFHATVFGHIAAVLLLVAALYTKQQTLAVGAALCLTALLRNRKLGLVFTGTFSLLSATIFFLLESTSHGWFSYYTLTLPSQHAWEPDMYFKFWTQDLGLPYLLPLLAMLALTVHPPLRGAGGVNKESPKPWPKFSAHTLFLLSLLLISWLSRLHTGGYLNVLMPIHAALALASGHFWPKLMEIRAFQGVRYRKPLWIALSGMVVLQWFAWSYNPFYQIPTREDREAGISLVQRLKREVGPILIPNHPYLAFLAGKKPFGHRMALEDVLRVKSHFSDSLFKEIRQAIASNSFFSIYLNTSDFTEEAILPGIFPRYYRLKDSLFANERIFRPRTGMKLRVQFRFVPSVH